MAAVCQNDPPTEKIICSTLCCSSEGRHSTARSRDGEHRRAFSGGGRESGDVAVHESVVGTSRRSRHFNITAVAEGKAAAVLNDH
jgi:hypothetical protein